MDTLGGLLREAGLVIVDEWLSADVRPNRSDEEWVSAIGRVRGA